MKVSQAPGPASLPGIGHAIGMLRDPPGFLSRVAKRYGDVVKLRFPGYPILLISHPHDVEDVLRHYHRHFVKDALTRKMATVLGNGLLTSEGRTWRERRRIAQPAFHHEHFAAHAEIMVRSAERAIALWRDGEHRDIYRDMMRLTLDALSEALFGVATTTFADDVGWAVNLLSDRFQSVAVFVPPSLPLPANFRLQKALRKLDDVVDGMIRERRATEGDPKSLLSLLLAATVREGGMDERQLRDEIVTVLLAGYETPALALSYAWYLLARHPEVETDLLVEIDRVLGERPASVSDLPRLRVAEGIIRESMRLYPPAWLIGREAVTPVVIGGYEIPRGFQIWISQWVVHRDPRFFPEPERFLPGRWTREFSEALPRYAFLPFGGGPRVCIGSAFALMESVLALVTIARRYRFSLEPDRPLQLVPSATLRPKDGIGGFVSLRKPAGAPVDRNPPGTQQGRSP